MTAIAATLCILAVLAGLWLTSRVASRRLQAERLALVQDLRAILKSPTTAIGRNGFAAVRGRFGSRAVKLEPHLDSMAVRKLPVLWLFVTVEARHAPGAILSAMMRPSGLEYWSPAAELVCTGRAEVGSPDRLVVKSNGVGTAQLIRVIEEHRDFFEVGNGKEILIGNGQVRLVALVEEADRSRYLVYRDARLSGRPIAASMARELIERASAIAEASEQAMSRP